MKLVRVDDGYIVAEAILYPRVYRSFMVNVARVMGGNVNKVMTDDKLTPVFPEKRMAEVFGRACGYDRFGRVKIDEVILKAMYESLEYYENKYVYGRGSVRKLMSMYRVLGRSGKMKISEYCVKAKIFNDRISWLRGESAKRLLEVIGEAKIIIKPGGISVIVIEDNEMKDLLKRHYIEEDKNLYYLNFNEVDEFLKDLVEVIE